MHLLGAQNSLLPYQGNKWKYRKKLSELIETHGFIGRPNKVFLNDAGPWGLTWNGIFRKRRCVIDVLQKLSEEDPKKVFDRLNHALVPTASWQYAAEFLFLQRLSHSGKAVIERNGQWKSPGFNSTSAYGKEGTDRFGEIKPMIPCLIRRLADYEFITEYRPVDVFQSWTNSAVDINWQINHWYYDMGKTVAYIDPDYVDTTGYGASLSREQVVGLAKELAALGAFVIVSEGEAIDALTSEGWQHEFLRKPTSDSKPFQSKKAEVVTHNGHVFRA